jgi:hypothetical protein
MIIVTWFSELIFGHKKTLPATCLPRHDKAHLTLLTEVSAFEIVAQYLSWVTK